MKKPKHRTRAQVESSKAKAERFVRDVLQDDDRADEIADESVESYAERRHFEIENPGGARRSVRRATAPSEAGGVVGTGGIKQMARVATKKRSIKDRYLDLQDENDALKEENEELQARLDRIVGVAAGGDGDDEDEFEDDDLEDDQDDESDDEDEDDDDE
jgi:hypothetical protein